MKRLLVIILSLSLCILCACNGSDDNPNNPTSMTVTYFDVGKADAALIECGGEYMMIDCGSDVIDASFGYYSIENFFKENNVNELKYVFCSHPDKDHFNGFLTLLENIKYGNVYCSRTDKDTYAFNEFKDEVQTLFLKKIKVPKEGDNKMMLGAASIEILAVNQGKTDNDSSIVMMITFGETKFLFTGDAENQTENYLIRNKDIKCTVLKAAHHGSESSSRDAFLQKAQPEYIIVSTDENTAISEDLLSYVENHETEAFYTYAKGTIICVSDGRKVEIKDRSGNILS